MKYCSICKKRYDTCEDCCPDCGEKFLDCGDDGKNNDLDDGELVAAMKAIGLF